MAIVTALVIETVMVNSKVIHRESSIESCPFQSHQSRVVHRESPKVHLSRVIGYQMQGTYPRGASLLAPVLGTAAETVANPLRRLSGAQNSLSRSVLSGHN